MSTDLKQVNDVLVSGMITQSSKVEEFENKLKEYFNYPYILTLNSATAGLTLALRLLDLPEGSEVICPPLTCFASTCAVLENRLKIVWADTDPETCNIDLQTLSSKITNNTKAIMGVHWGGNPIDLDKLKSIAGQIPIIEDCAHAFGAEYKNKKVGTTGNLSVFSLQAIKHLTTGDGGLIFLQSKEQYERAKLLRWFGLSREKKDCIDFRQESNAVEWGYKFHMNDINASIGISNLPYIHENIEKHRFYGNYYNQKLKNLFGVSLLKTHERSAFWIYTIKVIDLQSFLSHMKGRNIEVSQVHSRNDKHTAVENFNSHLPKTDYICKQQVSIPCGWWLTLKDTAYICESIRFWSSLYTVRELQKEDILEYAMLIKQLNQTDCHPDKHESAFNSLNKYTNIWVLTVNSKIVSTLKSILEIKFCDDILHIEDVITDSKHRNKLYGSYLLNYVLSLYEKKVYKVVLSCKETISPFYELNGFLKEQCNMTMRFK